MIPDGPRPALALAAVAVLMAAVFSLWPGLDLAVSRLFYVPGQGFPLASYPLLMFLREAIWRATDAMIAASVVGLVLAWLGMAIPGIGARIWGFVLLLYVIGPGLIVNAGLKSHWGRARPADVTDFAGASTFTPALWMSDQCDRNCSFVSGEAASATALAISSLVILWALRGRVSDGLRSALAVLVVLVALVGMSLRIATGRHFLSDVVFAVLIVLGVALVLARLLLRGSPAPAETPPGRR